MTSLRRAPARLAVVGLLVVATWEIAVLARARRSAPSPEDWKAASAAIPSTLAKDALIVFAPRWIDPVGRLWLGDRISLEKVGRMDAVRYREIWEVSIRGASAPEVREQDAVSEQNFGTIRVRRFVRNAPTVSWDLAAESKICEVDFEPRRGILLELSHQYAQSRRVFQQVSLGTELQLYAGLAGIQARADNRSTAAVQVMVDGREVARGLVANEGGWVALPRAATTPGPHDVEIIARVQDARGQVHLAVCVAAESRGKRP